MLLLASDTHRGEPPDDGAQDAPREGTRSDPEPRSEAEAPLSDAQEAPGSPAGPPGPEARTEAEQPPDAPAPQPAELPSYPRTAGPRATSRAAAQEQRRLASSVDEHGLPTYPRESRGGRRRTILDKVLVLVIALAAVLLIAYAVTRADRSPPPDSALVRAVDASTRAEVGVETESPERARQFVRDEFGWSVGVPTFNAGELRAVGIGALAPIIEVPVFFYSDEAGREAVAFALSYALLDQVPDRVRLSRADYDRLASDPSPRIHRVASRDVVLWRDRADIYILVTDIPATSMARQIRVHR